MAGVKIPIRVRGFACWLKEKKSDLAKPRGFSWRNLRTIPMPRI